MSQVILGESDGRPVALDVDVLLRTRLLIQAASGAGKSWAIRRLAEQLFGKVQVIILDLEGEFSTLREKFGFVLVGKEGETPADVRSAGLVATKLLELNACAVCDLYEMKSPEERHAWAKVFLEAMIDAPKKLWHPAVIIVDEAHVLAPEKGAGDSAAANAVISLATRGRKRGFTIVPATQRIGKLRKDVAAECGNVLVGRTTLDVDQVRAADALGVSGKGERAKFFDQMRMLGDGSFFAIGPAICSQRTLVSIGGVQTTHHAAGSSKHAAAAPPAPKAIAALLPKLADLPKAAEEKAQTEAELRGRLRELERELRAAKAAAPAAEVKTVEVPVIGAKELKRAETLLRGLEGVAVELAARVETLRTEAAALKASLARAAGARVSTLASSAPARVAPPQRAATAPIVPREGGRPAAPAPRPEGGGTLSGPEQRILDAIAWLESIGVPEPEQTATAFLAGYTAGGGAFNNPRGSLRSKGLVDYLPGDRIRLTDEGRALAKTPEAPLSPQELHERVMARLPGPERRILAPVLKAYPASLGYEELAREAGYEPGGGAFNNPRGRLRSLGLVEYPEAGRVRARSILFLEER